MKRSNDPIFWSMFGAGGMLAALIGPALVFITGIAVPLGFLFAADTMSYAHVLAFAQNWAGKIFLFAVVSLFLWHAAHRLAILMHDFGVHAVADGPRAEALAHVGIEVDAGFLHGRPSCAGAPSASSSPRMRVSPVMRRSDCPMPNESKASC